MTEYILVDMDGTLSNGSHRLHFIESKPKNWKAFFNAGSIDPVFENIASIVDGYDLKGVEVVIFTARPQTNFEITKKWLDEYLIPHNKIAMRKANDYRPDYIVKEEMLREVQTEYGGSLPIIAIDDKEDVLDMFKRNGVPVMDAKEFR